MRSLRLRVAAFFCALFFLATAHDPAMALGCRYRCKEGFANGVSWAACDTDRGDLADCTFYMDCIGEVCSVWCDGTDCYWA